MKNQEIWNKIRIITNYLSLAVCIIWFYIMKIYQWPLSGVLFGTGIFTIFLISIFKAFIKTKFRRIVHLSSEKHDAREMQIVLNALKYAYSLFSVVCLITIYASAITEYPINVLPAGGLLYLAYTLPASIVGWNRENIS